MVFVRATVGAMRLPAPVSARVVIKVLLASSILSDPLAGRPSPVLRTKDRHDRVGDAGVEVDPVRRSRHDDMLRTIGRHSGHRTTPTLA